MTGLTEASAANLYKNVHAILSTRSDITMMIIHTYTCTLYVECQKEHQWRENTHWGGPLYQQCQLFIQKTGLTTHYIAMSCQ